MRQPFHCLSRQLGYKIADHVTHTYLTATELPGGEGGAGGAGGDGEGVGGDNAAPLQPQPASKT